MRTYGVGDGEQVVIIHLGPQGPVEVSRHHRATPGSPRLVEEHFPPAPPGALDRSPRARTAAEADFLALGEGARTWLVEAAAGTTKMRVKMADALGLAKLVGAAEVDWALGHAAVHARFAEADLASILDHHAGRPSAGARQAGEDASLTQGTTAWARLGRHAGEREDEATR